MSNKNYELGHLLTKRSRREGMRGSSWKVNPTGLKRWARHCLVKMARAAGKNEIARSLGCEASEDVSIKTMAKPIAEVRVFAKGKRSIREVTAQAFTSPNPFHLRQMGYSSFGDFADDRWRQMAA